MINVLRINVGVFFFFFHIPKVLWFPIKYFRDKGTRRLTVFFFDLFVDKDVQNLVPDVCWTTSVFLTSGVKSTPDFLFFLYDLVGLTTNPRKGTMVGRNTRSFSGTVTGVWRYTLLFYRNITKRIYSKGFNIVKVRDVLDLGRSNFHST